MWDLEAKHLVYLQVSSNYSYSALQDRYNNRICSSSQRCLDLAQTDVPYYAIKSAIDASALNFQISAWYFEVRAYCVWEFKNTRLDSMICCKPNLSNLSVVSNSWVLYLLEPSRTFFGAVRAVAGHAATIYYFEVRAYCVWEFKNTC